MVWHLGEYWLTFIVKIGGSTLSKKDFCTSGRCEVVTFFL